MRTYNIEKIQNNATVSLDLIKQTLQKHKLVHSKDTLYKDIQFHFSGLSPTNLCMYTKVGNIQGSILYTEDQIHPQKLLDTGILTENTGTNTTNPFYSSQFSFVHPNGVDIYGSFYTRTRSGLYHYNTITMEFTQLWPKCTTWSYFSLDKKGNIYCSPWSYSSGDNQGVKGIFVITPDNKCYKLTDENDSASFGAEISTGVYLGMGNNSANNVYYIDNTTYIPTAHKVYSISYPSVIKHPTLDRVYISTSSTSYTSSYTGICIAEGSNTCVVAQEYGRFIFSTINISSSYYPTWAFDSEGNLYIISYDTNVLVCITIDNQVIEIAQDIARSNIAALGDYVCVNSTSIITVFYKAQLVLTVSITRNMKNILLKGDTLYFWGSSGFYIVQKNSYIKALTSNIYGALQNVYDYDSLTFYITTTYSIIYVYGQTVKLIYNNDDYTIHTHFSKNKQLLYTSSGNGYNDGFRGFRVVTDGVTKYYLSSRANNWRNFIETETGDVYVSSTMATRYSTGSSGSYYGYPSDPITGLHLFSNDTLTHIYNGYNWCYSYKDKLGNLYLSSSQETFGVIKVEGTTVKRICPTSYTFKYIYETPNGVLVSNSQYIKPNTKLLYIKNGEATETTLEYINQYNKEVLHNE